MGKWWHAHSPRSWTMRSREGPSASCVTVTCAVTVTRCEETAATCRSCTSITPSTPIMCVRSSPISTLVGVSSMRIATERRRSVSARGAMRTAIRSEAIASARVQPNAHSAPAATMTATDPSASFATSRNAAFMLRFASRPPARIARETTFASRPMTPTRSMGPASTGGGEARRHAASHATITLIIRSIPACRAAARTSERAHPHVCFSSRGRRVRWAATRATTRPEASTTMCPASAARDKEPDQKAPSNSATTTVPVTASAHPRRAAEAPAAWE